VASTDRVHEGSPSFEISGIDVDCFMRKEVSCQIGKAVLGALVQDGVSEVVGIIGTVGDSSLPMF